jgi:hypothetical protein
MGFLLQPSHVTYLWMDWGFWWGGCGGGDEGIEDGFLSFEERYKRIYYLMFEIIYGRYVDNFLEMVSSRFYEGY